MTAPGIFVFDSSPLVASCQFSAGQRSVADIVFAGAAVQIPSAVYEEVIIRGGSRPDALKAAGLVHNGYIQLADVSVVGDELDDLQHYQLGQGEKEAITLTARLSGDATIVTDDFLALIVANRLGLSCQLFLDFVVGRATRGELEVAEARQAIQAVSPRYPEGFVPHSLAMLGRLNP